MGCSIAERRASRLRAACVAACGLALAPVPLRAASGTGPSGARAGIDFAIVVPVILRVRPVGQARELRIADPDIARGYVDVDAATSLRVTSNNPGGFAISMRFDPAVVSRVVARIGAQTVEAASPESSTRLDAPKLLDAPLEVDYRIFLAPGARAGTYPWPVALALAAGA